MHQKYIKTASSWFQPAHLQPFHCLFGMACSISISLRFYVAKPISIAVMLQSLSRILGDRGMSLRNSMRHCPADSTTQRNCDCGVRLHTPRDAGRVSMTKDLTSLVVYTIASVAFVLASVVYPVENYWHIQDKINYNTALVQISASETL